MDMVIKNGRIVSHSGIISAGIAIDKGKIVAIAEDLYLPTAVRTIDAAGKFILPGLIDPHFHLGYFGGFGEQCETETKALANGGVTAVGIYIITTLMLPSLLETFDGLKKTFEGNSVIDGFFHGRAMDWRSLEEIPACLNLGVNNFKFLMGYKAEEAKKLGAISTDDGVLFEGFDKISKQDGRALALVHAENVDIILRIQERLKDRQDAPAYSESRPSFCESEAMMVAINIAKATGCPLYIVHTTIGEGIEIVAKAKAEGLKVYCETCPQYLTHTPNDKWFKKNAPMAHVNPPLRDKESIEKLWKGIKDGVVDTIGSDSCPESRKVKGDDLWKAPPGTGCTGQHILPVLLSEGVNKGRISLEKVVEVCCYNPAKIFGLLPQKGMIAVGSDADLVIVDLDMQKKGKSLYSAVDWSIYEDWELKGWPVLTMVRGNIVMENGEVVGKKGSGRYLPCRIQATYA